MISSSFTRKQEKWGRERSRDTRYYIQLQEMMKDKEQEVQKYRDQL